MMKKWLYLLGTMAALAASPAGAALNEWTFESDNSGTPLSGARNVGTPGSAVFAAGFGSTVFTTNRNLVCIGNGANSWSGGAVLDAGIPPAATGTHYLRYDLSYSLNDAEPPVGTLFSVYFAGDAGTHAAGLALGFGDNVTNEAPAGKLVPLSKVSASGSLIAIAEVNLDADTLKVWYSLGAASFASNSPNVSTNLTISTLDNLRFHATGRFQSTPSDFMRVGNIRHAATWAEITNALYVAPVLTSTVTAASSGMNVGDTNTITVVIRHPGAGSSPASGVFSTLSHNGGPSDVTIISSNNAPAALPVGGAITNTFRFVGNAKGQYTFTALITGNDLRSLSNSVTVGVGAQVALLSFAITNETGLIPGKGEPGEAMDIRITTINNGGVDLAGFTGVLSGGGLFTVTPASITYGPLVRNATTTTVYRVQISSGAPNGFYPFEITYSNGPNTWVGSFSIEVFSGVVPSVTNSLIINVPQGETASAVLLLQNSGNLPVSFRMSDDGTIPKGLYTPSRETMSLVSFPPLGALDRDPTLLPWPTNGLDNVLIPIGFGFNVDGTIYTQVRVSRYGALGLGDNVPQNNAGATLPVGSEPVAAAFWNSTLNPTNTVRYQSSAEKLVVAWNNGTTNEFQAWLYPNGNIRYLYAQGGWGAGAIGLQAPTLLPVAVNYQPGSGSESILLKPQQWVVYTPTNGSVAGGSTRSVVFTANASQSLAGTRTFTAYVNWGNGQVDPVTVTVNVLPVSRGLRIVPSPANFIGPAGYVSQTNVWLVNTGNVAVAYTVLDLGAKTAGYVWTNTAYSWINVPDLDAYKLTILNGDYTDWMPIGFEFPFYGEKYSEFLVNVDGGVGFRRPEQTIPFTETFVGPYAGNLLMDANSSIRYIKTDSQLIVTWENVAQDGGDSDLTFQAILNKNGTVVFQYKYLSNTNAWPNTPILVQDATNRFVRASLSNQWTTIVTTNYTTATVPNTNFPDSDVMIVVTNATNVVVSYTPTVANQALLFTPSSRVVLSINPPTGTVPLSGSNQVAIVADARSLTPGGTNQVLAATTFGFKYIGGTNSLPVNFTVTNSTQSAYPRLTADSDNDGLSDVQEWTAGTDANSGSSLFAVDVTRNSANGARTISWPGATDGLSRTYTVWYTTNLMQQFTLLATVTNVSSFVDTQHANVPAIYYRVKVK